MNTKRMLRWLIVLFLLAALPGMTAVLAQGQAPAGKAPLPAMLEPGESAPAAAWNVSESEPNNTCETADPVQVNDVVRGKISSPGDVDYFIVDASPYILADIDALSLSPSSPLDAYVCATDGPCDDDSDSADSFLFLTNGWYEGQCISVTDYYDRGASNYVYNLNLSMPMLLSAAAAKLGTGYVAGIPFRAEDILAWSRFNTGEEKWAMFFDGSDMGVTGPVSNIATAYDYTTINAGILLGVAANKSFPGLGMVTPYDVVRFDGTYGPDTLGTFTWSWRGRDHALTTAAEKIDAVGSWTDWYDEGYPVSTVGKAVVTNGVVLQDEDVGILERSYDWFWGGWMQVLDGSAYPGMAAEDVFAVSITDHLVNLVILGNGNIAGHAVTQKDVFSVCPDELCTMFWLGMWHGPDHGWNYNIDGMEFGGYFLQ